MSTLNILIALALVLAAAALLAWLRKDRTAVDATPDRPRPFGYKVTWLAVSCDDPLVLVDALRASDPRFTAVEALPCNWESGLDRVFDTAFSRPFFVTPAINGWVLGLEYDMPEDLETLRTRLEALSAHLDRTVFVFGSHRVVSAATWAVAERGTLLRAYLVVDGETFFDHGPPLPEESELGLEYWSDLDEACDDDDYDRLPDETNVLRLAERLSLAPHTLEQHTEPGVGWLLR